MKPKFLLAFLLLFSSTTVLLAQAHSTDCNRCAYYVSKPSINPNAPKAMNECGCIACNEKKEKERLAKIAEQKKADAAKAAKLKAEQAAKQRAFEEKRKKEREEAAKPRAGDVLINGQSTENSRPAHSGEESNWEQDAKKKMAENIGKMSRDEITSRMNEIAQLCKSHYVYGTIFLTQRFSETGYFYNSDPESEKHGSYSETYNNIPWSKVKEVLTIQQINNTSIQVRFEVEMAVELEEVYVTNKTGRRTINKNSLVVLIPTAFKDVFLRYLDRMQSLSQN